MKWQRRSDFVLEVRKLRDLHGFHHEIKWKKAYSKKYSVFFEHLVYLFFKRQWLAFRCITIRQACKNEFHNGDIDLA